MPAPNEAGPTMSEPVIDIRGLQKSYGRSHQKSVLKGVDLTVSPGMVMGLVGTNGEGKVDPHQVPVGTAQAVRRRDSSLWRRLLGPQPREQSADRLCPAGACTLALDDRATATRLRGGLLSELGREFRRRAGLTLGTALGRAGRPVVVGAKAKSGHRAGAGSSARTLDTR